MIFWVLTCYFEYKLKKTVLLGQMPKLNTAYPSLAKINFSGVNNEHKCAWMHLCLKLIGETNKSFVEPWT